MSESRRAAGRGRAYVPKDVTSLHEIPQQAARAMWEGSYSTANYADRSVFFSEQTRLETRFDDVKWTGNNGTAHPPETDSSV